MASLYVKTNVVANGYSYLNQLTSGSSYTKEVEAKMKPFLEVIYLNKGVDLLEKLENCLKDPSKSNSDITKCLADLKKNDLDLYRQICYQIWNAHLSLRDLDKDGEAILAENPRILLQAKNTDGVPLLEQYCKHFRQVAAVKQFKNALTTSKDLAKEFRRLPDAFIDSVCYKVWEIDGKPSEYQYGLGKVLSNPQILLTYKGKQQHAIDEAIEQFTVESQKKIAVAFIPDNAPAAVDSAKTLKILRYQGELEHFLVLLNDPSKKQEELVAAFKRLDAKVHSTLCFYVWICFKKPMGDYFFGQHKIEANPRLLLGLMDASKKNIVELLIDHHKSKVSYERNIAQVEKLIVLLKDPSSNLQVLQDSFRHLDASLKDHFAFQIWDLDGRPVGEKYGVVKIQKDPRILLNYKGKNIADELVESLKSKSRGALKKARALNSQELGESEKGVPGDVSIQRLIKDLPPESHVENWGATLIVAEFDKVINQGGLAVAPFGLAEGLSQRGHKVSIILPKYDILSNECVENADAAITDIQGKVHRVFTSKIGDFTCYFIEDEHFNVGRNADGTPKKIYGPDDVSVLTRFAHFSSLAADLAYKLYQKKETQIVHCHDWHTALVPKIIAERHPVEWAQGKTPPTVFTVHNNLHASQGMFHSGYDRALHRSLKEIGLEDSDTNAMIEGLWNMDAGTAVSRTFAGVDAQGKALGMGIDHVFREVAHQGKLTGIVNGANTSKFNTKTDAVLKNWKDPITLEPVDLTFGPDDDIVAKKAVIKQQLQKYYLLHRPEAIVDLVNKPLVLFLGRYDSFQKGLEMLQPAMESTLENNGEFIAIGIDPDDPAKEHLAKLGEKVIEMSEGVGASIIDDKKRQDGKREVQEGHGIGPLLRAAADFTLVPSKLEPCGLVQLEAMLHASLPICTKIGGLADTIISEGDKKNGFLFDRLPEWDSPAQKDLVKKAVKEAIGYWEALTKAEKNQRLKSVVTHARRSGWTESPDGSMPAVDQYRHVYASSIVHAQKRNQKHAFTNHFLKA